MSRAVLHLLAKGQGCVIVTLTSKEMLYALTSNPFKSVINPMSTSFYSRVIFSSDNLRIRQTMLSALAL